MHPPGFFENIGTFWVNYRGLVAAVIVIAAIVTVIVFLMGKTLKSDGLINNRNEHFGKAENLDAFTKPLCEDDCPDGEADFIYPEIQDDDPFNNL